MDGGHPLCRANLKRIKRCLRALQRLPSHLSQARELTFIATSPSVKTILAHSMNAHDGENVARPASPAADLAGGCHLPDHALPSHHPNICTSAISNRKPPAVKSIKSQATNLRSQGLLLVLARLGYSPYPWWTILLHRNGTPVFDIGSITD